MTISLSHGDVKKGLDLFNRARFFDAHEVLEDVWRALPRDRPSRRRLRLHLQGLIQLAVAFHHESTGNRLGARSVLERATRNLCGADESFPGLDFSRLRVDLEVWQRYLAEFEGAPHGRKHSRSHAGKDAPNIRRQPPPTLPKILLRS